MHADLVKLLDLQSKDAAIDDVDRAGAGAAGGSRERSTGRSARRDGARRRPPGGRRRRAPPGRARGQGGQLPDAPGPAGAAARDGAEPEGGVDAHGRARPRPLGDGQGGDRVGPERRGRDRARAQGRRGGEQGGRGGARAGPRARAAERAARRTSRPSARRRCATGKRAPSRSTSRSAPATTGSGARARRDVVVPLVGGTCGACHTSIPLNRRSQIRSGAIIDGCEGCGAILYPAGAGGVGVKPAAAAVLSRW